MRYSIFTFSFLATSAVASIPAFTNANNFRAMLKRGDLILKRQGYSPDTTYCGRGDTCAEACGANSVECPSTDTSMLYCHESNDGSKCCPDGSGNSCEAGYYCTSDSAGDTYCCPDGIDTANCAAQYSLSVSLVRQTGVVTPSATPLASTVPAETPVATSQLRVSGAASVSARASDTALASSRASATLPSPRLSTASAAASPSQATGGAGRVVDAGAAVLAGAVGLVALL